MRQSVLTIMGLTLIATAWGCATSATTTASTTTGTVGLKSLDGDDVFTGEAPEAPDGVVALQHQPTVSSGLWMEDSWKPSPEDTWTNPNSRINNVYKLMTPPESNEIAYTRTKRRRQ